MKSDWEEGPQLILPCTFPRQVQRLQSQDILGLGFAKFGLPGTFQDNVEPNHQTQGYFKMFVQKSGRVDDWTCLKSSCQKLLLLFNCGFDSTLHWIKQIRYCFSENARPSLKILWPTQLWVSQWKTHKCRKNTKTITGITFLPAISQTGAKTDVEIFWSFSNKNSVLWLLP